MRTFNELLEDKRLVKAVEAMGYETPTPIQEKAIPLVKKGKDMIAKSNTGTGKTAAFGLPLLEKIASCEYKQAIVICPTRELALQAHDELSKFSKYINEMNIVSVYGGAPIDRQIRSLKKGWQIVVGTPGRILDHMKRKTIRLHTCDCVVLDEADEMLNMGFRDDIEAILEKMKEVHQTILFSATMPKEIREIADRYLKDKVEIEVKSKQKTVDKIKQYYYDVRRDEKTEAVKKMLTYYESDLSIIFCNTKAKVDELVEELNRINVRAVALHGDIKQEKRTKIMNAFKKANKAVLVASDVAARGIDVNNIDLVINYDLPQDNEIYVHRIGRTGRAGKEGQAVTLIQNGRQFKQLKGIMKYTKAEIEKREIPSDQEMLSQKRNAFKEEIKQQAQSGLYQENLQLANELIRDGLSAEEIISALVGMAFGTNIPSDPNKKVHRKLKDAVELKFSLGKAKNVTSHDIEKAILGNCHVNEKEIGKIDVRRQYS
ncbi:MAG: DEAD/DEAH box helicase, partial [Erysipelotrichia bacterium]|nr:DEAD/DEAH box helicase [Erysipelotrichia bacterium]